jgi:asparagine synthase (glutamine-hydrolysing)
MGSSNARHGDVHGRHMPWVANKITARLHEYAFTLKYKKVATIVRKVIHEHLSYLDMSALYDLAQVAINNEKKRIDGAIIEAGCALGGSAITLASAKSKNRMFFVYDAFGMIPPPSEEDGPDVHERYKVIVSGKSTGIGGHLYYGYRKNIYDEVLQSFVDFGLEAGENNIYLKRGLFQDTLKVESTVSLAHVDCDWHDSVLTCLNRIEPYLARGGTLIIDDYHSWSGCRKAVHEYFENKDRNDYTFINKTALHIVKRALGRC